MAKDKDSEKGEKQAPEENSLQSGTYEIIRNRLLNHSKQLRTRITKLNSARKEAFGAVETKLLSSERISTSNNCVPRDMVPIGDKFIFGYNVFVGLRTETKFEDVFAIYEWKDNTFVPSSLDMMKDSRFETDFANLYKYYRHTTFAKFAVIGHHLFMVFRVGKSVNDVKTFKWLIREDSIEYLDNRSDHEYVFPPQHEFEWRKVTQDMHRSGRNPHMSIEDRVFVETIHGDLTIKIEDNTETGEGIYSEAVDNPDQTLSDAEVYYAVIGHIILLKIRPYEEKAFRYFIYNEKIQKVRRVDSMKDACVLLPEGHGLIFPKGYYLQTGEFKQFETDMQDMIFERRISSPNGEDHLYIFYNRESGAYVLLSYNMIEQKVDIPVVCHGYSFFENGTLIYFRGSDEAKKHHAIQIWQTPYYGVDFTIPVKEKSELHKIGNQDIVRCMAECTELMNLIGQEEAYANLYLDIANKAEDIRDSYFWLDSDEAFNISEPLGQIKTAADAAIEEYEKVVRARQNTASQIEQARKDVEAAILEIRYDELDEINEFVEHLSQLRALRGHVISLRDLSYADEAMIEPLEREVAEHTEKLSGLCVEFLLKPESLEPYQQKAEQQRKEIPALTKVIDAKELEERIETTATELEMLTDIVSNLKIEDATQTIAIIDNISLVYSQVNQVKSVLKNKIKEIGQTEGQAEFGSQIKLLEQSVINYLDVCNVPEKCDEYLTKATVQLETLESKFADFEDFVVQLAEKREEIYNAFESRKVQLTAELNRRTSGLMAAAERILKGIVNRTKTFTEIDEINGYFASDLMIERVRGTIDQLIELGDNVKAEDVRGRLKSIQQDAIRQLKDKQALYEDNENIIRLGTHRFAVNKQPLEATIVEQEGQMYLHLTGTGFFELIEDERLAETRDVWHLELYSETDDVYRAEYLAYKMLEELLAGAQEDLDGFAEKPVEEIVGRVQEFMGPRYEEGYVKGVHDHDAAIILQEIIRMKSRIGLLRYSTKARALAAAFWQLGDNTQCDKKLLKAKIAGIGLANEVFGPSDVQKSYVDQIQAALEGFADRSGLFAKGLAEEAAEYLFFELAGDGKFAISRTALEIKGDFEARIGKGQLAGKFGKSSESLGSEPLEKFTLLRDWLRSYIINSGKSNLVEYADEAATLLVENQKGRRTVVDESIEAELEGMVGSHERITEGKYVLNYCDFTARLRRHDRDIVPRFKLCQKCKNELVERFGEELRLDEFKPRVLTTFVRNRLIDQIYLPLIGDNLAKQIGAEGDEKRTDRQGLLLLISPPGYGKTTLMEYVADRLGLTFIKINGPAVGNRVMSLDPAEAPNAGAREELNKLNLAFEMGDNVMIYVDDIQHTDAEFLQKFISLCDAQRRVEGVYKGRSRTYDLRGKRVCVVMAGNPYTESGERFRIPDMLANRADTYNIGDIVGGNYDQFVLSYIENCLTSNPVLEKLARRSQNDVYTVIKLAETGQREGLEFEVDYSAEELNEYVSTMKKLFVVREVVLNVNTQYIASAGQASEYRTEPPFLLQGSYRNMNRIGSRVLPVMNDEELWTLIHSAYEQDAQTLTSGAESNLLKFRELTNRLNEDEAARWEQIKKTFQKNLLLGGETEDKVGKIIRQLNAFSTGLDSIKDVIADGIGQFAESREVQERSDSGEQVKAVGQDILDGMERIIEQLRQQQQLQARQTDVEQARKAQKDVHMLISVLEEQFKAMETWLLPMTRGDQSSKSKVVKELRQRFEVMVAGYSKLIEVLKEREQKKPSQAQFSPASQAQKALQAKVRPTAPPQKGAQAKGKPTGQSQKRKTQPPKPGGRPSGNRPSNE